jgi:hypothetical protein
MSETDLATLDDLGLAPRDSEDKSIQALTRTSEFLPQIRVYGSEATVVKEQKFPMGHLGLYFSAEKIVDLGEQFDTLVVDWRPRASIVTGDKPVSFFGKFNEEESDPNKRWTYSEAFIEVQKRGMAKETGFLVGVEFLLWVPMVKKFGLFLMGNPTLRRESPNVMPLLGKAATVKCHLIKTSKYTWHGAKVFECTTPFDMPPNDEVLEESANFRNPVDSDVEFVKDGDSSGSGRAR